MLVEVRRKSNLAPDFPHQSVIRVDVFPVERGTYALLDGLDTIYKDDHLSCGSKGSYKLKTRTIALYRNSREGNELCLTMASSIIIELTKSSDDILFL